MLYQKLENIGMYNAISQLRFQNLIENDIKTDKKYPLKYNNVERLSSPVKKLNREL